MVAKAAAALLLLLVLLAGCSGDGSPSQAEATDDTDFSDIQVEATATTGIIRGVVVDDRIVPIAKAAVVVTGADVNRSATSDDEGRFAFDDLAPGTYFILVSSQLYLDGRTNVDVVAGDNDPPVTKVQLVRRFSQEPFKEAIKQEGFIQCNQAGIYYATAPCVTDFTGLVSGNLNGVGPCTPAGCAPQLRTVQAEKRGFHSAVGAGWQQLVFEMTWEETSDTFERMGITVSYNVTQRPASHNYLSYGSESPLRTQLDVGVDHENSNDVEPDLLVPEGRPDLYYFVGVRSSGVPAVAVNQNFLLFAHFFYYGLPPEGWSFVNGDPAPF